MSKQEGMKFSTTQRRSSKTNIAKQPNSKQAPAAQRPAYDDQEAWLAYWKTQDQPWRTDPEIDAERQKYLAERRSITADIEQGIYPFKGNKLSRADVEWLLATHENGYGPVDRNDTSQHNRRGLDLRGADLRQVDLHGLPLACLYGGLEANEWIKASPEQANKAKLHLEGADLSSAHLECSYLQGAYLEGAILFRSHLEKSDLYNAHLKGAFLREAHLEGASLRRAFFDAATVLNDIVLGNEEFGVAMLSDVSWGDTNLSVVNWAQVKVLGDEYEAKQPTLWFGYVKSKSGWLKGYHRAVRANRQLARALQNQGLNEEAARFTYRAQLLQRKVFWYQRKFGQYLFSLFLDLLAGYGYRLGRSLIAYLLVIAVFATIYHRLGAHLAWNEAIVISMTAFHGRGFFPEQFKPGDPQALAAAIEALVGLLIEITLIATLTQRFFGK